MKYDATLEGFQAHPVHDPIGDCAGLVYSGLIFGDSKERYQDRTAIQTSLVQDVIADEEGLFIRTLNSVYKLGEPRETSKVFAEYWKEAFAASRAKRQAQASETEGVEA